MKANKSKTNSAISAGRNRNRQLRATVPTVRTADVIYGDREIPEGMHERLRWEQLRPRLNEWMRVDDDIARFFCPPKHTIFYELHKRQRMTLRQMIALDALITVGMRAQGNSHGQTVHMGERVQTPDQLKDAEHYQGARCNNSYVMFEHVHNNLHEWQKRLLNDLLTMPVRRGGESTGRTLMRKGTVDIKTIGHFCSNYKKDSKQSYSAGVGYIHGILDSIADLLNIE